MTSIVSTIKQHHHPLCMHPHPPLSRLPLPSLSITLSSPSHHTIHHPLLPLSPHPSHHTVWCLSPHSPSPCLHAPAHSLPTPVSSSLHSPSPSSHSPAHSPCTPASPFTLHHPLLTRQHTPLAHLPLPSLSISLSPLTITLFLSFPFPSLPLNTI